jgi:hypothetical protein
VLLSPDPRATLVRNLFGGRDVLCGDYGETSVQNQAKQLGVKLENTLLEATKGSNLSRVQK